MSYDRHGENNPRWQGGRRIRSDGYVVVYQPGHPFAYKNFVLEHRLVFEKHIGRYLNPDELVHHKNEIKHDNRIENLALTDHSEHAKIHFAGKPSANQLKPRATKEAIVELYCVQGLILRDCAEKLGISYGSLRNHMRHFSIEIRGKDPWWKRKSKRPSVANAEPNQC